MTNIELALALQKLSVHLQEQPEVEIGCISIGNIYGTTGEQFKAIAAVMPKPLTKRYDPPTDVMPWIWLDGSIDGVELKFHAERNKLCKLVSPAKPAVYECDPLLSPDEDAELTELTKEA